MDKTRILSPAPDVHRMRADDGTFLTPPPGWVLLPPGDAGLTRRVKAAGPTWTVIEKKGRKKFSKGLWAPAAHVEQARTQLAEERADPSYARKLEAGRARRDREQTAFVAEFRLEVLAFLRFSPAFSDLADRLARAVTEHATPVGSGTVARASRLETDRKAEAAVIAWLRHQTTAYDSLHIARVKGLRREVRRELAEVSRALLDVHRRGDAHLPASCPLCKALTPKPG